MYPRVLYVGERGLLDEERKRAEQVHEKCRITRASLPVVVCEPASGAFRSCEGLAGDVKGPCLG